MSKLYRQGDVLIEQIAEIPRSAKRSKGKIVLAHGEATGHAHTIEDRDSADWWVLPDGEQQYLEVAKGAEVVHQEHSTIALPAGRYRVTRQREYSPEAIRVMAD
jgi:hypothetical protein